jgi:hypothetical protein
MPGVLVVRSADSLCDASMPDSRPDPNRVRVTQWEFGMPCGRCHTKVPFGRSAVMEDLV